MSEFDKEVEQNLPLVTYIIRKRFRRWNEDLFQIGCIGLINGVKTYDPNLSTKKSTYYCRCIENELNKHFRTENRKKRLTDSLTISLNEIKFKKDDNFITLEDGLANDVNIEKEIIDSETREELYECLDTLSDIKKTVIKYTFGLCGYDVKTQEELASMMNVAQPTICRYIKLALLELKGKMEDKNKTL